MNSVFIKLTVFSALICAALLIQITAFASGRAVVPPEWNESPDPQALYGTCRVGGSGSQKKTRHLQEAGVPLRGVITLTVLECKPFDGPGGTNVVPCPSDSPYAVCLRNENDGLGNHIYLGVLKLNQATSPRRHYSGCPSGSETRHKLSVLKQAGEDPRLINGIVTLSCGPATGTRRVRRVDCPNGPHPYAYCLGAENDGKGNAVTLGVVAANGPGDPHALYGECSSQSQDVDFGFAPKMSLVRQAGEDTDSVHSITFEYCGDAFVSNIPPPATPTLFDCPDDSPYDYCIRGLDDRGNNVRAGVITIK